MLILSFTGIALLIIALIGLLLFLLSNQNGRQYHDAHFLGSVWFWVMIIGCSLFVVYRVAISILGAKGMECAKNIKSPKKTSYISMARSAINFMPVFGTLTMLSTLKDDINVNSTKLCSVYKDDDSPVQTPTTNLII